MQTTLQRSRILRAVDVAAVVVAIAGCSAPPTVQHQSAVAGPSSTSAPSTVVAGAAVTIDNFGFVPATLTVRRGDTVMWTNHDEEPHTVAANDGSFHSPGMVANGTYSFTFSTPGTFDYICSIHPFMHGTVVVTP